jgi:hypothetical protein
MPSFLRTSTRPLSRRSQGQKTGATGNFSRNTRKWSGKGRPSRVSAGIVAQVHGQLSGTLPHLTGVRLEEIMAETYKGDAYCVKCKEKRDFEGTVKVSDSGRRMAQGICSVCGTKLNRILGKADNA